MLSLTLAGIMAAWPTRAQEVPRTPASVPETHTAASDRFARLPQPPLQLAQVQPPARPQTPDETRTSKKLADPYRKWLNEDVAYIITDEERAAFKALPTNAELEQFIADFWKRRDPTPGTPENEFKEEHYRRIAYTNEHFATPRGLPGWKTDQGRIYITFGPPDEIDAHPNGGAYQRPQEEGGGTTTTYPFEQWRYRYIEGIGNNIIIEFVDRDRTGDFRMTSDPSEKDALAGAQAKAGATVNVVGNNGVQISVPLDRYGDRPVTVSARIVASDGRVVKTFENSVRGQMAFTQFLALTPGSYTLHVAVKDPAASSAAADSISFEVK